MPSLWFCPSESKPTAKLHEIWWKGVAWTKAEPHSFLERKSMLNNSVHLKIHRALLLGTPCEYQVGPRLISS